MKYIFFSGGSTSRKATQRLFTQHESHTGHQVNATIRYESFKCSVPLIPVAQSDEMKPVNTL